MGGIALPSNEGSQEETRKRTEENLESTEERLSNLRTIAEKEPEEQLQTGVPDPLATSDPLLVRGQASDVQDKLGDPTISFLDENIQKRLADEQDPIETFSKEATKVLFEAPLTFLEYAGHIVDEGSWRTAANGANVILQRMAGVDAKELEQSIEATAKSYEDAGNTFTEAVKGRQEAVDEMEILGIDFTTYREDPNKVWAPFDSAWYAQNISDLVNSVAGFAGLAGVAGAATRGAVSALGRAGLSRGMQGIMSKVGQTLTSTALAQTEGMAEATQTYQRVRQSALEAHLEKGKTRSEAVRLAEKAAGAAAAQTAGITLMAIPATNYLSVLPAFKATNRLKNLKRAGLDRQPGKLSGQWLERISDKGLAPQYGKQLAIYARESGFESIEELMNQFAQVEGQYRGEQLAGIADPSTLGERVSEEVFNKEGALAAALGAIGGGGQRLALRRIPMHQRTRDGETQVVSQATLQAEREMDRFQQMKDTIEKRVTALNQWQSKLAGEDVKVDGEEVSMRDAQNKLLNEAIISSFDTGTERQIKKLVQELRDMSDKEAESKGFETDEDSPYHYKKFADEYLSTIENLEKAWTKYNNDFEYTDEERAAHIPHKLFQMEAALRLIDTEDQRLRDSIDQIEKGSEIFPDEVTSEVNVGRIGSKIANARLEALSKVVAAADESVNPSDLSSIEQVKKNIENYEDIESEYAEKVQEIVEEEAGQDNIQNAEELSNFALEMFERDFDAFSKMEGKGWNQIAEDLSALSEETSETDNTVRSHSKRTSQDLIQGEIQSQGLKNAKRWYKKHLDYLETSEGRSNLMEEIKEKIAQEEEKRIQELRDKIADIDNLDRLNVFAEDLSVNESQKVKDEIEARRNELRTKERESQPDSESGPQGPSQPPPSGDGQAGAAPSGMNAADARESAKKARKQKQDEEGKSRSEQEGQDEPTGPTEPSGTEPVDDPGEPDVSPTQGQDPGKPGTVGEAGQQASSVDPLSAREQFEGQKVENIVRKIFNATVRNSDRPDETGEKGPTIDEWVENIKEQANKNLQEVKNDLNFAQMEQTREEYDQAVQAQLQEDTLREKARELAYSTPEPDTDTGPPEPTNVSDDRSEARKKVVGDNVEDFTPKIQKRSSVVNYQSRESTKIDGNIAEVSNQRNETFDKRVETPDVKEGMSLEYRLAEEVGEDGVTQDLIENAKIEVYAISEQGEIRVGAIPIPRNIGPENTIADSGNIEDQKEKTRDLRKDILDFISQNEKPATGQIIEKRGGHLSIRYDKESLPSTNPDKKFLPVAEAFENDDLQIYIIRRGLAHISDKAKVDTVNDFDGNQSAVEGSVGVLLPTPRAESERMAIPLHLPMLDQIDGNLAETIFKIIDGAGKAGKMSIDEKEAEIAKYLFIHHGSIAEVFNQGSSERVRIRKSSKGFTISREGRGFKYSNDPGVVAEKDGRPIEGNGEQVMNLLGEMFLNVDLNRINRGQEIQRMEYRNGEFRTVTENYDQFIKNRLTTDLLEVSVERLNGETAYIYFEQPTIRHQPTFATREQGTGPTNNTASVRGNRTTVNFTDPEPELEVEIEDYLDSLTDDDIRQTYREVYDAAINAKNDQKFEFYEDLRQRLNKIRTHIRDSRDKIDESLLNDIPPRQPQTPESEGEGRAAEEDETETKEDVISRTRLVYQKGADVNLSPLTDLVDKAISLIPENTEIEDVILNIQAQELVFDVRSRTEGTGLRVIYNPNLSTITLEKEGGGVIERFRENKHASQEFIFNNIFPEEFFDIIEQTDIKESINFDSVEFAEVHFDTAVLLSVIEPLVDRLQQRVEGAASDTDQSPTEDFEAVNAKRGMLEEINNIRRESPASLRTVESFNQVSRFEAERVIVDANSTGFVIDENASNPVELWKFVNKGREYYIPAPKRTGGYTNVPGNLNISFEDEFGTTDFLTRGEIENQISGQDTESSEDTTTEEAEDLPVSAGDTFDNIADFADTLGLSEDYNFLFNALSDEEVISVEVKSQEELNLVEVKGDESDIDASAIFDPDTLTITIGEEYIKDNDKETVERVLAHEAIHGILYQKGENGEVSESIESEFRDIASTVEEALLERNKEGELTEDESITLAIVTAAEIGLESREEVATYGLTNPRVARVLDSIPADPDSVSEEGSQTLWGRLKDLIIDVMSSVAGPTQLDRLQTLLDNAVTLDTQTSQPGETETARSQSEIINEIARINQELQTLEGPSGGRQGGSLAQAESGEGISAQADDIASAERLNSLLGRRRELAEELGISREQASEITEEGQSIPETRQEESTEEINPLVEEFNVETPAITQREPAWQFFEVEGEVTDNTLRHLTARIIAGKDLTTAEEAVRRELSEEVENLLGEAAQSTQQQKTETNEERVDPNALDLRNVADPQVKDKWASFTIEEAARHWERIFEEAEEQEDYLEILRFLRSDLYEEESWTYSTQSGKKLRNALNRQAEKNPDNIPADPETGQVDEDIQDILGDEWDPSPSPLEETPVQYESVEFTQQDFEEIVAELQKDGQVKITCRT